MAQCTVEGCSKDTGRRKSLCEKHYQRKRIHGDPLATLVPGVGKTLEERLDIRTRKTSTCWIFTGSPKSRYGRIGNNLAHRVAYEANYGPIPEGLVVRHKCDVPKCVRPDHLELGTHADNSRDMTSRKRQAFGERQGSARLTEEDILEIRQLYSDRSIKLEEIADRYQIVPNFVSQIALGQKWKHLPGRLEPRQKRLTKEQRNEAIRRVNNGETHQAIAEDYGVTRSAISQLIYRRKRAA